MISKFFPHSTKFNYEKWSVENCLLFGHLWTLLRISKAVITTAGFLKFERYKLPFKGNKIFNTPSMLIKKFLLMNKYKHNTVLLYSYKTKINLHKNIKPIRFKLTILIDNNRFNAEIKSPLTTRLLHHLLQQFCFFFLSLACLNTYVI